MKAEKTGNTGTPLQIALGSIKANRVPMVVLWGVVTALAVAYWNIPAVAHALAPIREWQEHNGWKAAFATQFVFCGVLPALFLRFVGEIKTERPLLKCFLQSIWCGSWGIVYRWFYAFQTAMFGSGHDVATLLFKTAFDEFVFAPLASIPATSFFFLWMASGFSVRKAVATCRRGYLRRVYVPNLISNWVIWIPAVAAVYAFDQDLQIQVLGFVSCFWALVCLQLGKRAEGQ